MLDIREDDLSGAATRALIGRHLAHSAEFSPETSDHSLALDALKDPRVTVWTVWDGGAILGCGALYALDPEHGEVKSMHTAEEARGRGVGAVVLTRLIEEGRRRGYRRLSLETGVTAAYAAARRLYQRHGFAVCPPFADYVDDPHSVYMTLALDRDAPRDA